VLFDGAQTLDVTGPAEVFASASRCAGRLLYRIEFASTGGGARTTSSGLRMETRDLLKIRPRRDDIVVAVGGGDEAVDIALGDSSLLRWLRQAHKVARISSSVCSGAFLLAAAGILDGRTAATHWSCCDLLAHKFPKVSVDANSIFVRDGAVWTSAGVTTGIDMALAIVEVDHGRVVANAVASRLVLYVRRPGFQSQFSQALVAQTRNDEEGLATAIAWARANLARVDIESFAKRAALSVRTLHRRCLATLKTTPARLLDKLRVEHARGLIETRDLQAKRVAVESGFGTLARMNRAFARELGMSARDYRALHAGAALHAGPS